MTKGGLPDLVYGHHSVSDVVESDLPIPIHIQNVKRLLGFLRLQEMLQVLRQYVCSAGQQLSCIMIVNSCAGWWSETLLESALR